MFGTTRSRKVYKGSRELGNNPLITPSRESEEELTWVSPRSVVSSIRYFVPQLPSPLMPTQTSPPSPPSSRTPPPPNQQFSIESAIKLPVFRGVARKDPDQFWFMVRAVWEAQGVTDDNIKKATLVSALQDRD